MNEKKYIKISLKTVMTTIIIALAIIAIVIFIIFNNRYNKRETAIITRQKMQETQGEYALRTFSNDEVKESLQKYLDLVESGTPENLLLKLGFKLDKQEATNDYYIKTNIKYEDYKNRMLNYVSEGSFNSEFSDLFKESDGYLCYADAGRGTQPCEVIDVTLKSNSEYSANLYVYQLDDTKKLAKVEFLVEEYNKKCVIAHCGDFTYENQEEDIIAIQEENILNNIDSNSDKQENENILNINSYLGKWYDNEPEKAESNIELKIDETGKLIIEIGIFRLAVFDDLTSNIGDDRINFYANNLSGTNGSILLKDNELILSLTSDEFGIKNQTYKFNYCEKDTESGYTMENVISR